MYSKSSQLKHKLRHPHIRPFAICFFCQVVSGCVVLLTLFLLSLFFLYLTLEFKQLHQEAYDTHLQAAVPWHGVACRNNLTHFVVVDCMRAKRETYASTVESLTVQAMIDDHGAIPVQLLFWYNQVYEYVLAGVLGYAVLLTTFLFVRWMLIRQYHALDEKIRDNCYTQAGKKYSGPLDREPIFEEMVEQLVASVLTGTNEKQE
jgi:hypothetical protein